MLKDKPITLFTINKMLSHDTVTEIFEKMGTNDEANNWCADCGAPKPQ